MPEYKYLIVGGGMTAAAAVKEIHEVDAPGTIGVISAEPDPPYNRPPLSKGLWKGDAFETIWRKDDVSPAKLHTGCTAIALDPANRTVTDSTGTVYRYEKLLLATGAAPRKLAFGDDDIVYFRTLGDYRRLSEAAHTRSKFAVIGGGFIGSEIAAALAMNGKQVVMSFPEARIGARMFPMGLCNYLNDYYSRKGVELLTGTSVDSYRHDAGQTVLHVRNVHDDGWVDVRADGVVAGIGVLPNVEIARSAGLHVENGIRIDAQLRTTDPNIYAAGDVASVFNISLQKWMRVEHEDCANTMGAMAGASMAGKSTSYDYLPFFYSDMFDLGFEAVGELDSRHEMVEDWKEPYTEGVVYYLSEGRVRGVLLWNVWEQVPNARKLIAEPGPFNASRLKGRIPG